MTDFLPVNKNECLKRGWDEVDFVYVTGDAYVDHPSFGAAIITRVLEAKGFKVAVLSQPDWHSTSDFVQFGKPRLGFLVTSGNIDSMVAHYTAAKKIRRDDAYTAGGRAGKRPDRAVIVYSNIIKKVYPDSPVIIGGLEASLRRFARCGGACTWRAPPRSGASLPRRARRARATICPTRRRPPRPPFRRSAPARPRV